jgi:hypothetical protein
VIRLLRPPAHFDEQITRRDDCSQSIADGHEAMRFEKKAAHEQNGCCDGSPQFCVALRR